MDRLTACLTLRLFSGIGPITAQKLVHAYGTPEAIFQPETIPQENPTPHLLGILKQAPALQSRVKQIVQHLKDQQISTLVWGTEQYPMVLARCPDAPLVLFVKGQMN